MCCAWRTISVRSHSVTGSLAGSGGSTPTPINGLGLLGMCISEGPDRFVIRTCFRLAMNFEEFLNL